MRRRLWIGGVVVALLGATAGVAAWQLGKPDETVRPPTRERASAPDKRLPTAAPASRDVEQRLQRLERKLAMLERQGAMARVLGDGEGDNEGGAQGSAAPATVDDPVFEMAVRDVVERVGTERAEEERVQRQQRMQRWADRWTEQAATAIKLSAAQKLQVQQIVREHFEGMLRAREAYEGPDAGARSGGFRERRRAMREALDKRLSGVLTPSQMRELELQRESGDLPGPGGPSGRGRRD